MLPDFDKMVFSHDIIFSRVLEDLGIAQRIIELACDRQVEKITRHEVQSTKMDALDAKGVRFDVEFIGDGCSYVVEMQRENSDDTARRARYYHSMLAMKSLQPGQEYDELADSIVIFICTFDPLGRGLARYDTSTCYYDDSEGTYASVGDGMRTVYLNARYTKPNVHGELLELLEYIRDPKGCEDSPSRLVRSIDTKVERLKNNTIVRRQFMTYEESIRREAKRRAKDMAKDMAEDMAHQIIYAVGALQRGEDLPSITKRYGQDAVNSDVFQQIYKAMHQNGGAGDMSEMNLQ